MFARMDANGDGVLDQSDREARQDERFAKADTDGNGQLSREEIKAAQEQRAAKMRERKGAMAERGGDRRGHEVRGMGGKGGRGMMMLRAADTNGDKTITRAEFDAAAAKRFAKWRLTLSSKPAVPPWSVPDMPSRSMVEPSGKFRRTQATCSQYSAAFRQ